VSAVLEGFHEAPAADQISVRYEAERPDVDMGAAFIDDVEELGIYGWIFAGPFRT
jgi:hypothetical protein